MERLGWLIAIRTAQPRANVSCEAGAGFTLPLGGYVNALHEEPPSGILRPYSSGVVKAQCLTRMPTVSTGSIHSGATVLDSHQLPIALTRSSP